MMTGQEILDSYLYKLVQRVLKHEYPFIKSVTLSPEQHNAKRIIVGDLDIEIDPYRLVDEYNGNLEVSYGVYLADRQNKQFRTPGLYLMVDGDLDLIRDIYQSITTTIYEVINSSAIPRDLKYNSTDLDIGDFIYNP